VIEMDVAVMSDSHDNLDAIDYFVNFFNEAGADVLLHAGDFISPFTVPRLTKFEGRVIGVFGNNDGDHDTLKSKAKNTRVEIHDPPYEFTLDNLDGVIAHKPQNLPSDDTASFDLMIHGHTHERSISRRDDCLILNPGECGGWLSSTSSGCLYNTNNDSVSTELVPAP